MSAVFADTFFWVALINPRDSSHAGAVAMEQTTKALGVVTTEEVLTEVLNFFAEYGTFTKTRAVESVKGILANPHVRVQAQSSGSFHAGLVLYTERLDQGYSLTDCISMTVMMREDLRIVLTKDRHFRHEGFQPFFA